MLVVPLTQGGGSAIATRLAQMVDEAGTTAYCANDVHVIADNFSYEAMRVSTAG
jgi:hypothetical protein